MNIAGIGAGGRALSVLSQMESENIVALADVDWARGAEGFKRWEKATRYKDFRQMLDKEKTIDAVTVITPDHMHATQALAVMQRGKHVYVEKPLTRAPWGPGSSPSGGEECRSRQAWREPGAFHDATGSPPRSVGESSVRSRRCIRCGRASWPQSMQTLPC